MYKSIHFNSDQGSSHNTCGPKYIFTSQSIHQIEKSVKLKW
jgi:hypothetical protein